MRVKALSVILSLAFLLLLVSCGTSTDTKTDAGVAQIQTQGQTLALTQAQTQGRKLALTQAQTQERMLVLVQQWAIGYPALRRSALMETAQCKNILTQPHLEKLQLLTSGALGAHPALVSFLTLAR